MAGRLLHRFCVRLKASEALPEVKRRIFITQEYLSDEEAGRRYEVLERIEHLALSVQDYEEVCLAPALIH